MVKRQINNKNANKLRFPNKNQQQKGGIKKKIVKNKPKIQDARQKILQKKRKTVVDARDVLAKMAKTQDARNKLIKLREGRSGGSSSNVKVIGSNIVRKTDRNGKIILQTNKSKGTSNMNLAIQKQLGLLNNKPTRKQPMKRISNPRNVNIKKTILNNLSYEENLDVYDPQLYKWSSPEFRTASQMISSLEARKQALKEQMLAEKGWNSMIKRAAQNEYFDEMMEEDMPLVPSRSMQLQGTSRISNIHSRLDTNLPRVESHGILSQTKTKVVVPAGHRIVVSNLQPTVTQDDIKELFEDIGQLLTAQLVRPGVAEVIYKNLKDAQKAVDTYHNRQLDGQPMKCLLVNKRPLNHPTGPAIESDGILAARKTISNSSNANKLVPDINTIHKVLFQRK